MSCMSDTVPRRIRRSARTWSPASRGRRPGRRRGPGRRRRAGRGPASRRWGRPTAPPCSRRRRRAVISSPEPVLAPSSTETLNRPASPNSSVTGVVTPCRSCIRTARAHASPTASRTSSRTSSPTPLRRAMAAAISRAVRTCAAFGGSRSVTVTSPPRRPVPVMESACRRTAEGLVHRRVHGEHLVQAGDPEQLQHPLLRTDQRQAAADLAGPVEAGRPARRGRSSRGTRHRPGR